ncbi:MAG: LuxR C-terminal-related transcriptional regulator, partial [Streptosporangiaceae bacterium]
NLRAAWKLGEGALQEFIRQQDARNVALTRYVLADIALGSGELDDAEQLCRRAVLLLDDLGDLPSVAIGIESLSVLMTARHGKMTESWNRAVRGLAAADAIRIRTGCQAPVPVRLVLDGLIEEAKARLGATAFEEAWTQGLVPPVKVALAQALAPVSPPQHERMSGRNADSPLTPREQEVAELVAAGLTNREVARRLGIAEWTVVNHLRKIMRKLECSSRVQVASWLTKHQGGAESR